MDEPAQVLPRVRKVDMDGGCPKDRIIKTPDGEDGLIICAPD